MADDVKASLTISYSLQEDGDGDGDGLSGQVWLKMDDEYNTPAGEAEPRSRFVFGEPAYFVVFHSENVQDVNVDASEGTVSGGGSRTVSLTEELTYAGEKTASVSVPIKSVISTEWRGKGGMPAFSVSGSAVNLSKEALGIMVITYMAQGAGYSHKMGIPDGYDTEKDPGYSIVVLGAGVLG